MRKTIAGTGKQIVLAMIVLVLGIALFTARVDGQTATNDDATQREVAGLLNDPKRGFVMSQAMWGNSFAAHLGDEVPPLSVADLSTRGAAYDPLSETPVDAGMALFYLARPMEIMRGFGDGGNEIMVRVLEARFRWLAGDPDAARVQIEDLLVQFAAIGGTEAQMSSIFADAAVLAWRDGDVTAAQTFFDRALLCTQSRCPGDFVFDWLGPKPRADAAPFEGFEPDRLRDTALDAAQNLLSTPAQTLADITSEWQFATGRWSRELRWALDQVALADTLGQGDQSRIRKIADRLLAGHDIAPFLFSYDTVATELEGVRDLDRDALNEADIPYIHDRTWRNLIIEFWPILHRAYLASDRPGDRLIARQIEGRLLMAGGAYDRAFDVFDKVTRDGQTQGFSAADLHSVWMDQWAAATLSDQPAKASAPARASAPCRQTDCGPDLIAQVAQRNQQLPEPMFPRNHRDAVLAEADAFLQQSFTDANLLLANLYRTGAAGGQNRPMDAARNDVLSLAFAEQAAGLPIWDLVARAAWTMDTLIYAGQFREAVDVGDRIAARVADQGQPSDLSATFLQLRARASFRMGEPRAEQFYTQAVDQALSTSEAERATSKDLDLALDLLDTGFDEELLRLIGPSVSVGDIRARALLRLGQSQDAAVAYRAFKQTTVQRSAGIIAMFQTMFLEQAATHLNNGNLDAAVAAFQTADAVETGLYDITDHPLTYAQSPYMRAIAVQEAHYLDTAGQPQAAQQMAALARQPGWPTAWPDNNAKVDADTFAYFKSETIGFANSMSLIQPILAFRDNGNYQGAAVWMRSMAWVAQSAEANGTYADAQTLWQMAFTFARGGETEIAFDLMKKAARIASTLSFQGASDGTLQLLERDRWRYLLFVDIAWAAATGVTPDQLLVVSRY